MSCRELFLKKQTKKNILNPFLSGSSVGVGYKWSEKPSVAKSAKGDDIITVFIFLSGYLVCGAQM